MILARSARSVTQPEPLEPNLGDATLIGDPGTNTRYAFWGDMDDLKVWSRALTPAEVARLCPS